MSNRRIQNSEGSKMNQHSLIIQEWKILKHCTDLGCPSDLILRDIPEYSPLLREEMEYRFDNHWHKTQNQASSGLSTAEQLDSREGCVVEQHASVHPYVVHSRGSR